MTIYFCESGNPTNWDLTTFHTADPLWDGKQCGLISLFISSTYAEFYLLGGWGRSFYPKHNILPPKNFLIKKIMIQGVNYANTSAQVSILECIGTVIENYKNIKKRKNCTVDIRHYKLFSIVFK